MSNLFNNNQNKRAMEIYNTLDYSRFKFVNGNRKIDHYKNVAKSIEKIDLTAYNPILVTKQFEILDGQNRFEACKLLGKPIYYLFCELDMPAADIIRALNTKQRNWRTEDYVQSWVDLGNEKMIAFANWCTYYGFDNKHYGVAAKVYFGMRTTDVNAIREGTLPEKSANADKLASWLCAVRDKNVSYWITAHFVEGVVTFAKTHTDKEMAKVLRHIEKISQFGSASTYINRFQQIVDAVKVR